MKNLLNPTSVALVLIVLATTANGAEGNQPYPLGSEEKATRFDPQPVPRPIETVPWPAGARTSELGSAMPFDHSPRGRVGQLNDLVSLSEPQKKAAEAVFQQEQLALDALPRDQKGLGGVPYRQASRAQIRELLTPKQQAIYDRAPQMRGGGLTLATPEIKLARLKASTALTPAQELQALQIYRTEFEGLVALAPDDRGIKGVPFRKAANDQIQALTGHAPPSN